MENPAERVKPHLLLDTEGVIQMFVVCKTIADYTKEAERLV